MRKQFKLKVKVKNEFCGCFRVVGIFWFLSLSAPW